MKNKRVLIVGATGFFGPHVVRAFKKNGDLVSCLLRPDRKTTQQSQKALSAIQSEGSDFLETDPWQALPKKQHFDLIVNLAAYGVSPGDRDPAMAQKINVELPTVLLNTAGNMSATFIHAGSSAEYAEAHYGNLIFENDPPEQARLYGKTKANGTFVITQKAIERSIGCAVLRLFNLFGEGEAEHRLIPALISKLNLGNRVALSPGTQVRDFIYAADAASAFVRASEFLAGDSGSNKPVVANICTGKPTSVADFARIVAKTLNADPTLLGFGDIAMRPDDLPWVVGSAQTAQQIFGWKAAHSLEKAIAKTVLSGSWT